jgi:hypothetical protein
MMGKVHMNQLSHDFEQGFALAGQRPGSRVRPK